MFFYGTVEGGTLKLANSGLFSAYFSRLTDGTRVQIEVKKDRKYRTLPQNALYWVWLEIIGDDLGYDKEEVHATFKSMFLTDRSQKIPLVRSTTKLDTQQFTAYLEKLRMFCLNDLNINLPDPEQVYG